MARAAREGLGYLFKQRMTSGVKKLVERLAGDAEWMDAGQALRNIG